MNRGVLHQSSSPYLQQMMAGNPNWWSINNNMRPPQPLTPTPHHHHHQQQQPPPAAATSPFISPSPYNNIFTAPPSSSPIPACLDHSNNHDQQLPAESWSQLLLGGVVGNYEQEKGNNMLMNQFEGANNKINSNSLWEEQVLINLNHEVQVGSGADVKQENSSTGSSSYHHHPHPHHVYGVHASDDQHEFQAITTTKRSTWSQIMSPPPPASSPNNKSCVASLGNNMLDFAATTKGDGRHPPPDRSSHECNSSGNGGAVKKARTTSSTTESTFKVRKEKVGDRITALHQLVSPFGKTDTASVLLEAIGYIRFLQNQIEALSLPYLNGASGNARQQQSVQGERNCIFPEDPGQLLNDNFVKRKGGADHQQGTLEESKKDLRSRGLCLVPVSCTLQVGSDNGADYWAPAFGGGRF